MTNSVDLNGKPFHFIGIGGIGMSALAYILANRHLPVSGSDIRESHITEKLAALGAHIFSHQDASNLEFFRSQTDASLQALAVSSNSTPVFVKPSRHSASQAIANSKIADLPQVICSTAINAGNLEYQAALNLGCPIFHRSDLLAALIQEHYSIAVAGTHGKTTTSSAIGYVLLKAGLDPTIIVGGEVKAWDGNARLGHSQYLVAEADESDGSLVKLACQIGVVTNIELDHPDHYKSLEQVVTTFQTFAQQCQHVIGCIDCQTVRDRLQPTISYSLNPGMAADYTVSDVVYGADGTLATVWERGEQLGQLRLPLLGQHNLSNALAAIAVGRLLGVEFMAIADSLATFEGARRRFELRGVVNDIQFIDDYAHHPSELQATLAAAKLQAKPQTRVVAIFQPHRYSRTLTFLSGFASSFSHADAVVLTDIYSAGEPNPGQIDGETLAALVATHHPQVTYLPTLAAVEEFLVDNLRSGDTALFLGAGNLNQIIPNTIARIKANG